MKRKVRLLYFLLVLSSLFFTETLLASNSDSLSTIEDQKLRKPSTMNDTWFLSSQPERHYVIDSTIFHLEDYNVVQRDGKEYMHTGNTGSATYPLVFDANRSTGFNTGYNQFDIYRYKKDSVKYYQVVRPYTELTMIIGLNNEQLFGVKFANQHKNMFYYGVDFTRIFSKGIYQNQKNEDDGFNLYGIFNSKNKHWNVQADLIFNSFKTGENGGVQADPFNSVYFKKSLVPVTDSGSNNYRQIDFYLKSSFNAGKKYYERKNDSIRTQTVLPVFKISCQFNIEKNIFKYRDVSPDSLYYEKFYLHDSVYNNLDYLKFGNAVMLDFFPRKLTSDSTYSEKDFVANAEAGFDYYFLTQNNSQHYFGNLYVAGTIRNNYSSKHKILYRASIKYFPYGWNQHDFLADATVGYDFGKVGIITGNFTYQLKEAAYIFQHYDYLATKWNYLLPKTKLMAIGGKYQNQRYGIIADLNYYIADHLPVYPGFSNPYLTNGVENIFVAHLGNRNGFYGLHLDNDVWFTAPANNGLVKQTYPMLVTKHSIYYERRVFKKVLWFSVGFDLRYRYQNNAPYYDPLLAQFYPSGQSLKTFPVLDFFVNLKIKTVRVFLKVDNISSSFGTNGYYAAFQYPATDISFRAGVKWRFFE